MEKLSLALPSMFGDHHVTEVRRVVGALPGIGEIYASSSFQLLDLAYDPQVISPEKIMDELRRHGYLDDYLAPVEIHKDPADLDGEKPYFRHTASIQNLKQTISFQQDISTPTRPLWPCPGLSLEAVEEEVDHA